MFVHTQGHLYAGSEFAAVQMPVSNCSRYESCVDCILARDPYCAWDFSTPQCSSISSLSSFSKTVIQSLKQGDVSQCPQPGMSCHGASVPASFIRILFWWFLVFLEPVTPVEIVLKPGNNIQLPCELHSNLAQVFWRFNDQALHSNDKYIISSGWLLILAASEDDNGLYICDSVEQINGRMYNRTMVVYSLHSGLDLGDATTAGNKVTISPESASTATPETGILDPLTPDSQRDTGRVSRLEVAVALLSLLCLSLMGVIFWIWARGRLKCLKIAQASSQSEERRQSTEYMHIQNRTSEIKLLGAECGRPCTSNNNHCAVDFKENGVHGITSLANISSLNGLGYINDESEIWLCGGIYNVVQGWWLMCTD